MTLKLEGPIPGGNLPPCRVLRCPNESAYLATISHDGGASVSEQMLCEEHAQEINAGAPWRWDDEQRVFFMGADREFIGERVVTKFQIERRNFETDTELGAGPLHLTLHVAATSSADAQEFQLILKRPDAASLGAMLAQFAGPPASADESA